MLSFDQFNCRAMENKKAIESRFKKQEIECKLVLANRSQEVKTLCRHKDTDKEDQLYCFVSSLSKGNISSQTFATSCPLNTTENSNH